MKRSATISEVKYHYETIRIKLLTTGLNYYSLLLKAPPHLTNKAQL